MADPFPGFRFVLDDSIAYILDDNGDYVYDTLVSIGDDGGLPVPINTGAPVATGDPVVSGTAVVGSTLSCTTGTWYPPVVTYTYAWFRDTSAISGATSSTYLTVTADIGQLIKCRVTATNDFGSNSVFSNTIKVTRATTTPRPPQRGQMPRTRETTLRHEVLKADEDFIKESLNPVEYEFSSKTGKREFRGFYRRRGPYNDD